MNKFGFTYTGHERNARRIILERKLATAEELSVMSNAEVASIIDENFTAYRLHEDWLLVPKELEKEFNKIVVWCCR